ncbi:DUF4292 domain-containing protein [uncultured Polaribacter sp.]|uniref:DUF4292 domain-containing protein n=1 Tax=uncultured Polaribacter sp. TaxID=174711 RepID=UPI0026056E87|nr:DUF4292 domain-containing protein [uncultured Polaribacter sp.]
MDENVIAKEISAKKVVRKHIATHFDKETVDAKLKANFNDGKIKQSISVYLKIIKDEVIWLKGTKFISVFKAKITPTSVQFYSPLEKKYFEGDFAMLEKLLGTEINFQQLQNLFLGQAILDLKLKKQKVAIENNSYVLSPQLQANLFDAFFAVNPSHFKLDQQSIVNSLKGQRLDIKYPLYKLVEDEVFPQEINIKAKKGTKLTTIDFELKSVEFNTEINTSFTIPKGYKRINL